MMGAMRRVLARLDLLRRREEGAAAVEFALILPIMLLLYIGSVEGSTLITMDRKLQTVAGSLGDLVTRWKGGITTPVLTDYFEAASGIMTPYPVGDLRQVVTQVQVRADGSTSVVWSREYANNTIRVGTDYTVGSSFNLPAAMTDIARGDFVIVSEGTYTYTPRYGFVFDQPIAMFRQNFFMPRFGGSIAIN